MQTVPQTVFDTQIAYNVVAQLGPEAQPTLADVRQRILREFTALQGDAVLQDVAVLQVPVFHATTLSLHWNYSTAVPFETVAKVMGDASCPDALQAAGSDDVQSGGLRGSSTPGSFWIFAAVDNLRCVALAAIDAAAAAMAEIPA